MIKEAYVSFEVAKLLKEKGFNEKVDTYYLVHPSGFPEFFDKKDEFSSPEDVWLKCPTHQMAIAWLREEKNICIVIEPYSYDYVNEKNLTYSFSLWEGDNYNENPRLKGYSSYDEAVEVALKYVLENLI